MGEVIDRVTGFDQEPDYSKYMCQHNMMCAMQLGGMREQANDWIGSKLRVPTTFLDERLLSEMRHMQTRNTRPWEDYVRQDRGWNPRTDSGVCGEMPSVRGGNRPEADWFCSV